MQPLGVEKFVTFEDANAEIVGSERPGLRMATSQGHTVTSYRELLAKVAALSFYNPRFRLLFRGQAQDYKLTMRGERGSHSSLYPSVLRPYHGVRREVYLDDRFKRLSMAEGLIRSRLADRSVQEHQLIRWAILQHYEVCPTPLLDVTLSLQSALTFAVRDTAEGFLFVLAFPQLTGPISVSIESMTQVVDLSQVCPPEAKRPHFQAGALVGDYPGYSDRAGTHAGRGMIGNNFACRLLAKFHLTNCSAWCDQGFTPSSERILFPDDGDEWFTILHKVREDVDSDSAR